jgi:hypothetical protein
MSLRNIVAAIRRRRQEPPPPAAAEAQADLVEVTTGCVAVIDTEIREARSLAPSGVRVAIQP